MASEHKIELTLSEETMNRLVHCAAWRKVSVGELAVAYVEDWIDVEYPGSHGRFTRKSIYRDGRMTIEERIHKTA